MSILPDWRIRELALSGMIDPFEDRLVRTAENAQVISYGLSSFGYDLRCADEWKIFTNVNSAVVDPKHFDERSFVDIQAPEIIIPPNSFALARSLEYMRIPDDVMVVALGKSTYARCFSGDTRVALADGRSPTLEEMARGAQEGELYFGYSIGPLGQVLVTELTAPRYIGRDSLLELTLDTGETIQTTPDHEFLTRDGRMVAAGALTPGAPLMPLYRSLRRGYEMTFQPLTGYMLGTHRMADEWNLRHGVYESQPGTHRHHLDGDRLNNAPWNITRMEAGAHLRLHNEVTYGEGFHPQEHGAAISDALTRLRENDAWYARYRAAQATRAQEFWTGDLHAATRADLLRRHRERWTDEERQAQRERLARFWADHPQARGVQGERSRQAWQRDDGSRRAGQANHARTLKLREDVTEASVRRALDQTGSIRGAAGLLDVDRSAFRRFPDVLAAFRGQAADAGRPVVNHKVLSIRELPGDHDVYCLTVPEAGNFALEAGVFVSNCGIVANVTPLEPGWEGHVTLEFSNTTPLPAKMYAFEGCVQLLFFQGERPEVTYGDRQGKYQGQRGVTLPRL
ncbi:dCTP deaminase [Deinococcus koreensis]|uniref:dCTP deaminase n=1 Tax=Deinococcus koreensis TaxID=2054903 RepID=A0A2K3UVC9_9DEIO|nr:dCTP deaminase [Deinococcus koreensis]PNY80491.1 dCTP deaminase [Deinococcus koreensis]